MSRRGWAALGAVLIMAVTVIAAVAQKAAEHASAPRSSAVPTPVDPPAATSAPASPSPSPTSSPSPSASAQQYTNALYGFSFTVPPGFTAQAPPVDGDGLSFTNADRSATITGYGGNNVLARTPVQELAQAAATRQAAGDTVTYRFHRGDVIAVSGTTPQHTVFYQREVVYPAVIYALEWTYPGAGQTQYDTLVTASVDSFRPGPAHPG